jgi:hypothetical protein
MPSDKPEKQRPNYSKLENADPSERKFSRESNFVIERIRNTVNAAEGTLLPPQQRGDYRLPFVSNLRLVETNSYFGGTSFTLNWVEPENRQRNISQYNVYVVGLEFQDKPIGPFSTDKSPITIRLVNSTAARVTFFVQTQLNSGFVTPLDFSPSVSGNTIAPRINSSSISPSGVTAGTYGDATHVGQFTVNSSGIITAAADIPITFAGLSLAITTKTNNYTINPSNYTVLGDTTGGDFTIKLPASPGTGDIYVVKQIAAVGILTLDGHGNNIDGAATIPMGVQYLAYTVQYNGTEWSII